MPSYVLQGSSVVDDSERADQKVQQSNVHKCARSDYKLTLHIELTKRQFRCRAADCEAADTCGASYCHL